MQDNRELKLFLVSSYPINKASFYIMLFYVSFLVLQ